MERPPEFRPPDPCQGGSSFTTHLQCIFNRTPVYTWRDHCHAQKKFCQRVCANDLAGGEPRSRSAQQRLPSRKTRPQSAHSDADGCRPHYSRIDNQLNKALVTSCRRPDRGKIPEAFFFLRDRVRMIRLIVCKSCTMNVKLQPNHINELSVAWSELPGKEPPFPVLRAALILP